MNTNVVLAADLRRIAKHLTATSPGFANVHIEEDQVTAIKAIDLGEQRTVSEFMRELQSVKSDLDSFSSRFVSPIVTSIAGNVREGQDFVSANKATVYVGVRLAFPKIGYTRMRNLETKLKLDGIKASIL